MRGFLDIVTSGQLLLAAIITGTIYATVGLGLNLVYGTMRLLNVAHGDVLMLGAYLAFWAFSMWGLSPFVSAVFGGILAALLGALLYFGLLRWCLASPRMRKRIEPNSLLIFIGISVVLQNLVALAFTGTPQGYQYLTGVLTFGHVVITANRLGAFVFCAAICLATVIFLRLSITGLAVKALIQRKEAAAIVGVNVRRIELMSLCAGFASAAVTGALVSMTEQTSPFMGFPFTIAAFIVIILGGLGNLFGGLMAGLLLGFIETYGVAFTSASWSSILLYGVFIAALILRPEGLLSARQAVH
jgi:branched-chain amino acid transport system permease protein